MKVFSSLVSGDALACTEGATAVVGAEGRRWRLAGESTGEHGMENGSEAAAGTDRRRMSAGEQGSDLTVGEDERRMPR